MMAAMPSARALGCETRRLLCGVILLITTR